VAHLSTARSAELVRAAKRRGLPVTCEVTPHHLTLTDAVCCDYDTQRKCAPPLRDRGDVAALNEALADGTIDAVATDHAPHSPVEKELEFDNAAFGMTGLETALPAALRSSTRRSSRWRAPSSCSPPRRRAASRSTPAAWSRAAPPT
jgi:dihydroorotase